MFAIFMCIHHFISALSVPLSLYLCLFLIRFSLQLISILSNVMQCTWNSHEEDVDLSISRLTSKILLTNWWDDGKKYQMTWSKHFQRFHDFLFLLPISANLCKYTGPVIVNLVKYILCKYLNRWTAFFLRCNIRFSIVTLLLVPTRY